MNNCKLFINCSAPICPLDPDWQKRTHLEGERVCYYLTEYSKEAARPLLRGGLGVETYSLIAEAYPAVVKSVGPVRRQLRRSSKNPPRIKA